MKITSTVMSVQAVDGQDFLKVWLEHSMSFIINHEDPALRKFTKSYILTIEVQNITVGFSKPNDEAKKSLKSMLEWVKGIKGYINLKGAKIVGIQVPEVSDVDFSNLPDINPANNAEGNNHLRLAANGGVRV